MQRIGNWVLAVVLSVVLVACSPRSSSPAPVGGLTGGLPAEALAPLPDSVARLYDEFFLEAMVQRQRGNNDAAFDLLRHCLDINPNAAEAYYFLSQYYTALKDKEKALDYIRQAARLNPGNETYMENLAQAYIHRQDFPQAITVVEQLYDRNKEREELLEMLFQLYQQVEDYPHAIGVLERIEAIDGKSERLSVAKSEVYTRMGNTKAAIAEMATLAKKFPNDLNYLARYGESLMMNGQTKRALAIYHRILDEEPDNNRVLMSLRTYYQAENDSAMVDSLTRRVLLGKTTSSDEKMYLLRQVVGANERAGGDSTEVLRLFRQVMDVDTADVDMALSCATYMSLKQMPQSSINPVLERVLTLSPDNAAARLQLVSNAWDVDDMDRVIDLCTEARQYNPDEMAFYYYQGVACYRQDRLDMALQAFQNGIGVINDESDPAIVSDFYAVMGDILHQKGQAEAAYAAYDSCLQWKDDNIGCLNNYAYYLSEQGEQLGRAEQMSYKTIKAEPKNATYLDTYAWILFMQQRYSEARIYIDQAMQNMSTTNGKGDSISNATIYEHAGDIYVLCGEPDKAEAYWQDALKGKAGDPVLIRKIKLKKYIKE